LKTTPYIAGWRLLRTLHSEDSAEEEVLPFSHLSTLPREIDFAVFQIIVSQAEANSK
jgi:hypothetical protein